MINIDNGKLFLEANLFAEGLKPENGHQGQAQLFISDGTDPLNLSNFKQISGQPMGFVNYTDLSRLIRTITQAEANFSLNGFRSGYMAFGAKHGNCCGAARSVESKCDAIRKMLEGDPVSIFGGFTIFNFKIDVECAETLLRHNSDVNRLLDGIVARASRRKQQKSWEVQTVAGFCKTRPWRTLIHLT